MAQNPSNMDLDLIVEKVCRKIAPMWSLENFVAVNPFFGLSDLSFQEVAHDLKSKMNISILRKVESYQQDFDNGLLSEDHLKRAIILCKSKIALEELLVVLRHKEQQEIKIKFPLYLDKFAQENGRSWVFFIQDFVSDFCSFYFDKGQALRRTVNKKIPLYQAWRIESTKNQAFSSRGLRNFNKLVTQLPKEVDFDNLMNHINIPASEIERYFHSLLLRFGGWGAYLAGLDWDNRLYGNPSDYLKNYLFILLSLEVVFSQNLKDYNFNDEITKWKNQASTIEKQIELEYIFQTAADLAYQDRLIHSFYLNDIYHDDYKRPQMQAVFCIDVRSEVYRRHLERKSPNISTIGFAGFFGFPVKFEPIAHQYHRNQCPVLIPSGVLVKEGVQDSKKLKTIVKYRKIIGQTEKLWKHFRTGAVSCFSFVSSLGLWFLPKMWTDSMGFTRPLPHPDQFGLSQKTQSLLTVDLSDLSFEDQLSMAKGALTAMSLKKNFARLVLIVGHGSNSTNNPHATGLDCGACGGNTGKVNALVASEILNKPEIREALANEGIVIPEDVLFLACLHDTTTDEVIFLNEHVINNDFLLDFEQAKKWLFQASLTAREERSLRLNLDSKKSIDNQIFKRAKDWSQVRPEWGLAGCHIFIVAHRKRSGAVNLKGESFLHSYDWKADKDFKVLELIMTAPMVVTSWINLQYYASSVNQKYYGAGNKTLHNVTSGIGVLEGAGGDLRVGLPFQSVHDGTNLQHKPLRLKVVIEAPIEEINNIIKKHKMLLDLFDNQWIYLFGMNSQGQISHKYSSNFEWESIA